MLAVYSTSVSLSLLQHPHCLVRVLAVSLRKFVGVWIISLLSFLGAPGQSPVGWKVGHVIHSKQDQVKLWELVFFFFFACHSKLTWGHWGCWVYVSSQILCQGCTQKKHHKVNLKCTVIHLKCFIDAALVKGHPSCTEASQLPLYT